MLNLLNTADSHLRLLIPLPRRLSVFAWFTWTNTSNAINDKCRLPPCLYPSSKIGCLPMTVLVSSVQGFDFHMRFLFLKQEHHMHQSHPCHSSPLMNADMFNEDCISVLEYRSIAWFVSDRETPLSKLCSSYLLLFPLPSFFQTHLVSSPVRFSICYLGSHRHFWK